MRNLELKQQLLFCEKYGINPNELLLLEIILLTQEGDSPEIVKFYLSSRLCARGSFVESLQGLYNSGIINKSYKIPKKGENVNLLDIPLNKNVIKDFHKCSFEMGKELWEVYPQFGIINGSPVGIRSISKKFNSPEDFFQYYGKSIRWKPELHDHIIELINWGKENNIICTTLANFIIDKKYEELEAIRDGDVLNINYDSVKLV